MYVSRLKVGRPNNLIVFVNKYTKKPKNRIAKISYVYICLR
jgi:hypothetical protein